MSDRRVLLRHFGDPAADVSAHPGCCDICAPVAQAA